MCVCVHLHVLSAIVFNLCMFSIGFSRVAIFICLPVFVTADVISDAM